MSAFTLRDSLTANVQELLRALGSATRPLSLADLAGMLNARDGGSRNASMVQRWRDGAEPDIRTIRLMSILAGVTMEEFAFGPVVAAPVTKRPIVDDVIERRPPATPSAAPRRKSGPHRRSGGGRGA